MRKRFSVVSELGEVKVDLVAVCKAGFGGNELPLEPLPQHDDVIDQQRIICRNGVLKD